ncbi:MAG: hypothetical protein IIZ39_03085 [Blautia sp.]|nr:hypothetical protein [Blautia sp.]
MCDLDGPSLSKENPFIGGTSDKGPKIILGEKAGISLEGFPVRFEKVAGR